MLRVFFFFGSFKEYGLSLLLFKHSLPLLPYFFFGPVQDPRLFLKLPIIGECKTPTWAFQFQLQTPNSEEPSLPLSCTLMMLIERLSVLLFLGFLLVHPCILQLSESSSNFTDQSALIAFKSKSVLVQTILLLQLVTGPQQETSVSGLGSPVADADNE